MTRHAIRNALIPYECDRALVPLSSAGPSSRGRFGSGWVAALEARKARLPDRTGLTVVVAGSRVASLIVDLGKQRSTRGAHRMSGWVARARRPGRGRRSGDLGTIL